MDKVTYKELKNALIHVDNSVDTAKVYDIDADIRIQGQNVIENIESGNLYSDGAYMASFSSYNGISNLTVQFNSIDSQTRCAVLEAINAFIEDLKVKVTNSTMTISNAEY